jgi:hypothetical protein
LTFSALEVGRAAPPQSITISNTGDGKLTVSSVTDLGCGRRRFSAMNGCRFGLAKNQRCSIGVSFKPSASGAKSSPTLDITTSDQKITVSLAGSIASTAPKIALVSRELVRSARSTSVRPALHKS